MHSAGYYYSILLWAALLYGAGVVFKFGSVFLYEAFMPWVSDAPADKRAPKPHSPRNAAVLWWVLGAYLVLSGLAQIPPVVALASRARLLSLPSVDSQVGLGHHLTVAFLGLWTIHPIMYNILIFMIEAVLGLFLLTERGTLLGRITAGLTVLWGLIMALFPEGLGYLLSTRNSWWAGTPGAGLVLAGLALLLAVHRRDIVQKGLYWGWIVLWGLGTLWQLTFFSSARLANLFRPNPHLPEPRFVLAGVYGMHNWALADPVLLNILLVLAMACLTLTAWMASSRWAVWTATVLIALLWWLGQNVGLTARFSLILNTAPLWGAALWSLHAGALPVRTPDNKKEPQKDGNRVRA